MKNLVFSILLVSITTLGWSQPNLPKEKADSLWTVWEDESLPDTSRLKAIHKIAWDGYLFTKPDSAFYFAVQQYNLAKEKGLKKNMANALSTQGASFYLRGDYVKAIDYFIQSLKIKEEIGDKQGIASSLNNIGNIYKDQGDYAKALDSYNKSQKIYEEIGDKQGIASSLNNIGIVYKKKGDYAKALDYYTQSQKIYEEIGIKKGMADALNNIGNIYKKKGDYAKALDYYTQSLKIQEEIGNKQGIADALNNIGLIYHNQGDYTKAIESYTQSLKIYEEIGNKLGIGLSLNNIGVIIYQNQGDYAKAIDYYTQSLKIDEELGNKQGIAASLSNIGAIYKEQGDYGKAMDYYTQSLKIYEEIGYKQGIARSLNNIGIIYKEQGEYAKALDYSSRSLSIAQGIGSVKQTRYAASTLIYPYIMLNSTARAVEMTDLLQSLRLKDLDINFPILSEQEKEKYFTTMQGDFDLLYDFAMHHIEIKEQTDKSYNNALLIKGLTLKSSTAMRQSIQSSGDTSLINNYENWLSLKKKIANANKTDSTYKELVTQANEMERELVKNSTVFSDFDKVKNLQWQDVQAGLKNNEAAIEFVHFKSEIVTANPVIYAALIVKKDSKHPQMVKLCTEKDLKEIIGTFQGNNLNFVNSVYGNKDKAQKALYEKVWQPMEKNLEGVENIYLSPSGLLHKIAFSAIAKDKNTYLCDNYNIRQQNSTGKVALAEKVNIANSQNFLMLGGVQYNTDTSANEIWSYLPGTLEETTNIKSYLKKKKFNITHLTASEAGEEQFKEKAPEANILHIATHGFFFPDPEKVRAELKENQEYHEDLAFRGQNINPDQMQRSTRYADWTFVKNKNPLMRSGLALAHANDVWQRPALAEGEDGVLTASEVSTLNLQNTDLVVLSACETGLGDIKGSEGVYGLQRAFKMAGAKYLIMSLWQVPDKETAEFMELFYKNLIKLEDIPEAFNKTQKAMRKKYDPYYWAAFVLVE